MKFDFHMPSKEVAKGKSATVICMALIIVSLYMISYYLFLRTIDVDVTKDASITYSGESGTASVSVENKMKVYNQRIQEFMDSITYEVTPQAELSNENMITIQATYDKDLARRYNIHPINAKREVKVKNLPIRFSGADEMPNELLKKTTTQGETYLKNNIKAILSEDFTSFYVKSEPTLKGYELKYRVFLDSMQGSVKDKILNIYAISANGQINTAKDGDAQLENHEETIYYMVTFNEINTSLKLLDENIYGEKMIVNKSYDLSQTEGFERYITDKYHALYHITNLKVNEK